MKRAFLRRLAVAAAGILLAAGMAAAQGTAGGVGAGAGAGGAGGAGIGAAPAGPAAGGAVAQPPAGAAGAPPLGAAGQPPAGAAGPGSRPAPGTMTGRGTGTLGADPLEDRRLGSPEAAGPLDRGGRPGLTGPAGVAPSPIAPNGRAIPGVPGNPPLRQGSERPPAGVR